MSKIYNEIEIDMNPESSSFEEVIFEDSFEYDGDMMLMQEDDELMGSGTWQEQLAWGSAYQQGQGDIEYQDLYSLIGDPESQATHAEVIDYIRRVTGWTVDDIDDVKLHDKILTMPSMLLDQVKKEAYEDKYNLGMKKIKSQFGSITDKLGMGREKLTDVAGKSGVRAPGQGGYKGMSELTSAARSEIGGLQDEMAGLDLAYEQDIYGLQGDVEREFADWASMQAQDIYG
tara:strand:- start:113 stop:802 length:690 start_codon:yes stop_codon:yes gene_type:complete